MTHRPTVFIHTNHKQKLGAIVSAHSFRRNSAAADRFDVRLIEAEDYPLLKAYDGRRYLRDGIERVWLYEDLQSFTPLRFAPPALMGYQGRAVVTDPDVFAVGDVWELLSRDMGGKAILAKKRGGGKAKIGAWASSVMLLDCAKLGHWRMEETFRAMFDAPAGGAAAGGGRVDYMPWISLLLEDPATIGLLEDEWNHFDRLTDDTRLLHNTRRLTQPWKTGLPADWRPAERNRAFAPLGWLERARRRLFGPYGLLPKYQRHPDRRQEALFFTLLEECLNAGAVSEDMLRAEIAARHLRADAFDMLDRARAAKRGGAAMDVTTDTRAA